MHTTILQRVGVVGLLRVVWATTPILFRMFSMPYSLVVYGDLLAHAKSLDELLLLHGDLYNESVLFRLLRPHYSSVRHVLKEEYAVK